MHVMPYSPDAASKGYFCKMSEIPRFKLGLGQMRYVQTLILSLLLLGASPAAHNAETGNAAANSRAQSHPSRPIVGAIRWDAWFGPRGVAGIAVEKSLGPAKWHYRLPFYAKALSNTQVSVDGASQEVMDQEIRFAADAGLDYWAFVSYAPDDPSSLALRYYLSSKFRDRIHFALIFEYSRWGKPGEYQVRLKQYADRLTQPGYLKVLGDRPLVFLAMGGESVASEWGGFDKFRESINYFRAMCRRNGAGNPYIVVQQWNPAQLATIRREIDADAVSAYSIKEDDASAEPYSRLAAYVEQFWVRCREAGSAVVPIVMTGWDRRPRIENPVPWETWQKAYKSDIAKFYQPPTPKELAHHLNDALSWVQQNPAADPADVILIYAWNEIDEGGWLLPTLSEGTERLGAIKQILMK